MTKIGKTYITAEWRAAQYAEAERHIDTNPETQSSCGGWGWDPPCGGCDTCMMAQFDHQLHQEETRARTLALTGLDVAEPIRLDYFPGFGGYHSCYDCQLAGELTDNRMFFYPWEKRPS